jgi:hypothetical protein
MACSSVVSATSGAGVPQSMRVASGTWGRWLRQRSAMPCSQLSAAIASPPSARRLPARRVRPPRMRLAVGDLFEQQFGVAADGVAELRVAGQFAGDDGHRAQRCAQLVGGAGGEVAQGDDALVAQAGLAGLGERLVAAAKGSVMRTTYHTMTPPTPRR